MISAWETPSTYSIPSIISVPIITSLRSVVDSWTIVLSSLLQENRSVSVRLSVKIKQIDLKMGGVKNSCVKVFFIIK